MSRKNASFPRPRPHLRLIEGGGAQCREAAADWSFEAEVETVTGLTAADLAAGGPPLGSPALLAALDAVAGLPACDLVLVPSEPDRAMLEAGAAAGGVDPFTAGRVYRAMMRAAE